MTENRRIKSKFARTLNKSPTADSVKLATGSRRGVSFRKNQFSVRAGISKRVLKGAITAATNGANCGDGIISFLERKLKIGIVR